MRLLIGNDPDAINEEHIYLHLIIDEVKYFIEYSIDYNDRSVIYINQQEYWTYKQL